jgi:acyl-coenzyme A thioesterase PaaI-like protein
MKMALRPPLAEGETFATIGLKINFLKSVWTAKLRAVGRLVKRYFAKERIAQ